MLFRKPDFNHYLILVHRQTGKNMKKYYVSKLTVFKFYFSRSGYAHISPSPNLSIDAGAE